MAEQPIVLLVDHDEETLNRMATALAAENVQIARANDGNAALLAVRQLAPMVIVLDLMLPGLSGAAVMAQLRLEGNDVPIVLVSGVAAVPTIGTASSSCPSRATRCSCAPRWRGRAREPLGSAIVEPHS